MFTTNLLQKVIIGFACFTALGILVHDTKFDQAMTLALPIAAISFGLSMHAFDAADSSHTHVERASMSQLNTGNPRIRNRDDHRMYVMPKFLAQGNASFGSSAILWPSV